MKLRLWIFLSLLAGLLLLFGCQVDSSSGSEQAGPSPTQESLSPKPRTEFALAYDASDTLNPLAGAGSTNLALAGLVYEGLFELDPSFQPQPLLCASYTSSDDNRIWTFTIRPGLVFSNGTPLTAQHVSDSLNAARSSDLYTARLAQVSDITAGDGVVTVTLHTPNGALPALLDIPIILSGAEDTTAPLGTGPYYYDVGGGGLSLSRNPYWQQARTLPLETIPLRVCSTADDRIAAFDSGLVSVVSSNLTASNALGYSGSYETWDCPSSRLLYLGFNCSQGPCRDLALRQALSRGINRSTVVTSLLSSHADATVLPVHPDSPLYNETLAGELDYSVSAATQLLEDGGYVLSDGVLLDNGRPVELNLVVNSENSFRMNVADYLAEELSKLGVAVTVTRLPWEEFLSVLSKGSFDLYLAQIKLTADFDLSSLLTGPLNYGTYRSEETSALLAAFRAASSNNRQAAASALYANLTASVPFAPLCFLHDSVLTQWGIVSGLAPTQQNPFYRFDNWSIH